MRDMAENRLVMQRWCPTDEPVPERLRKRRSLVCPQHSSLVEYPRVVIPLVWTVVHDGSQGNISDEIIGEQMRVLNEAFRGQAPLAGGGIDTQGTDARMQFSLHSIRRVNNPDIFTSCYTDQVSIKQLGLYEPADTLYNVYTCSPSGGILGYAVFPDDSTRPQGIVLAYGTVGSPEMPGPVGQYDLGDTGTHEVGGPQTAPVTLCVAHPPAARPRLRTVPHIPGRLLRGRWRRRHPGRGFAALQLHRARHVRQR